VRQHHVIRREQRLWYERRFAKF